MADIKAKTLLSDASSQQYSRSGYALLIMSLLIFDLKIPKAYTLQ